MLKNCTLCKKAPLLTTLASLFDSKQMKQALCIFDDPRARQQKGPCTWRGTAAARLQKYATERSDFSPGRVGRIDFFYGAVIVLRSKQDFFRQKNDETLSMKERSIHVQGTKQGPDTCGIPSFGKAHYADKQKKNLKCRSPR